LFQIENKTAVDYVKRLAGSETLLSNHQRQNSPRVVSISNLLKKQKNFSEDLHQRQNQLPTNFCCQRFTLLSKPLFANILTTTALSAAKTSSKLSILSFVSLNRVKNTIETTYPIFIAQINNSWKKLPSR
jgi:hypothetical protein